MMFVTTAVGAGIDKDGIQRVLHIGDPYSSSGTFWKLGRGGRGGDYVETVIQLNPED